MSFEAAYPLTWKRAKNVGHAFGISIFVCAVMIVCIRMIPYILLKLIGRKCGARVESKEQKTIKREVIEFDDNFTSTSGTSTTYWLFLRYAIRRGENKYFAYYNVRHTVSSKIYSRYQMGNIIDIVYLGKGSWMEFADIISDCWEFSQQIAISIIAIPFVGFPIIAWLYSIGSDQGQDIMWGVMMNATVMAVIWCGCMTPFWCVAYYPDQWFHLRLDQLHGKRINGEQYDSYFRFGNEQNDQEKNKQQEIIDVFKGNELKGTNLKEMEKVIQTNDGNEENVNMNQ
eukprot:187493_1